MFHPSSIFCQNVFYAGVDGIAGLNSNEVMTLGEVTDRQYTFIGYPSDVSVANPEHSCIPLCFQCVIHLLSTCLRAEIS